MLLASTNLAPVISDIIWLEISEYRCSICVFSNRKKAHFITKNLYHIIQCRVFCIFSEAICASKGEKFEPYLSSKHLALVDKGTVVSSEF